MISTTELSLLQITKQVEKICSHKDFKTKRLLCKLLRYLVRETLDGREEKLKGYTIGLEVFDKPHDFDPDHDPLVRIHAGRLRRILKMYYLEEGKNDSVKIDIPKGKYIPNFSMEDTVLKEQKKLPAEEKIFKVEPSVVILPFKNLSGNPEEDYFALGLSEELSVEFTKFEYLNIYGSSPFAIANISADERIQFIKSRGIHFIVEGGVHRVGKDVKIIVKLIDTYSGQQIWANQYTKNCTPRNIIGIQENISNEVSSVLGSEFGVIMQSLTSESKRTMPKNMDVFDAILKYHYYEMNHSRETAYVAFMALNDAVKIEPNSGLATAMLASLYSSQYLLNTSDGAHAHEQLCILSEKAIELNPHCLTARIMLAVKYFMTNEKLNFLNEIENCLSMNPKSPIRLGAIGLYLALYGEWEKGKKILDQVIEMNVRFPLYILGVTTLYYYRKKEYHHALIEANQYQMPALFWGPMLRAATLGQLNRVAEAEPNIAHLQELKPEFEKEARYLISRFVKQDELVEHVMEGLQKAGMALS